MNKRNFRVLAALRLNPNLTVWYFGEATGIWHFKYEGVEGYVLHDDSFYATTDTGKPPTWTPKNTKNIT